MGLGIQDVLGKLTPTEVETDKGLSTILPLQDTCLLIYHVVFFLAALMQLFLKIPPRAKKCGPGAQLDVT